MYKLYKITVIRKRRHWLFKKRKESSIEYINELQLQQITIFFMSLDGFISITIKLKKV